MATDFKTLIQFPETIEERQARWFRKLRGWVPQGVWFENIATQELTEVVQDTIEQTDFGTVKDLATTDPLSIFNQTVDTTEVIGISVLTDIIGNTFTPADTFEADKIGIDLKNLGSFFGELSIELWSTSAGLPNGGALATTGPIKPQDLQTSHGTIKMFSLTAPVTLTGGIQYAILVNKGTIDGDISVALASSGDPFAGGTYFKSENNGSSYSLDAAKDISFQVNGFKPLATLDGRAAQRFFADYRGDLYAIRLALHTDVAASTGTIRVEVVNDDNGNPGLTVYGYADIDVTTLPVGPTGIFFGYAPTNLLPIVGDKDYWLVFRNIVIPDAKVYSEGKLGGGLSDPFKVSFDSGNIWSTDLTTTDLSYQIITERTADADLEGINVAVFQSIAAVMAKIEGALVDHVKETYICEADGAFLSEHGYERNVNRALNELDISYRERIKNITNSTSCPTIKQLVDALLPVGECTILEDFDAGLFLDRDVFLSRGEILIDPIYNAFSIIVDKQVHPPYSFYSREYFSNRSDFIGQQDSRIELFEIIVEAVNSAKALGTVYRLVERLR